MRTLAWMMAVCATFLLTCAAYLSLKVSIFSVPGFLNPTIAFHLIAGKKILLAVSSLVNFVTVYIYWVVRWIEHKVGIAGAEHQEIAAPVAAGNTPNDRLKAAIREGDIARIQQCLVGASISREVDAERLTPLELAELYGNPEVIALLAGFSQARS